MSRRGVLTPSRVPSAVAVVLTAAFLLLVCALAIPAATVAQDPACSDGVDNDGDGRTDYQNGSNELGDFGCTSDADNSEAPNPECSDGIDNDADGKIDGFDDSCSGPRDRSELVPQKCSDGVDNDNDGHIDHPFDPGCASPTDNDETPDDGDGDGLVDRDDTCPSRSGTTPNGCPNVSRSLTLGYAAGAFRGKLSVDETHETPCRRNQTVIVWRKVGSIGGANDVRLGRDTTNRKGNYVLAEQRRPGKYYSTANRRTIATVGNCLGTRSPVLTLG